MISLKHIGVYFALAWLSSPIFAQIGPVYLKNKGTDQILSAPNVNGPLQTIYPTQSPGPDEAFILDPGPESSYKLRPEKDANLAVSCPTQFGPCQIDYEGTFFYLVYTQKGYLLRSSDGQVLTVTNDVENKVIIDPSDGAPFQLFDIVGVPA